MDNTSLRYIENSWKNKTNFSNELFNEGRFKGALAGYKESFRKAEELNYGFLQCLQEKIPFMQIYIIYCNNIACTYEELGQKEEAENIQRRVIYYLYNLAGAGLIEISSHIIQSELNLAYLSYVSFVEKYENSEVKKEQLYHILKKELIKGKFQFCN